MAVNALLYSKAELHFREAERRLNLGKYYCVTRNGLTVLSLSAGSGQPKPVESKKSEQEKEFSGKFKNVKALENEVIRLSARESVLRRNQQ